MIIDTFESYARKWRAAARGYGGRPIDYNKQRTDFAVISGLEAATDGRIWLLYYQEALEMNTKVFRSSGIRIVAGGAILKRRQGDCFPGPEQIAAVAMGARRGKCGKTG